MIRIFQNVTAADRIDELEQAWRLRHRVFVEEKNWTDLARADGREIDQFDHDEAVHLCVMRGRQVVAYARMLPTTRAHLLSDVLPELCRFRDVPRGADTREWTRLGFGVEPLCLPTPIAGEMAIGLHITVSEATVEKTRRLLAPERIELPKAAMGGRDRPAARA